MVSYVAQAKVSASPTNNNNSIYISFSIIFSILFFSCSCHLTFFFHTRKKEIRLHCGHNSILLFSRTQHLLSFGPIGSMRPDKFSNKHRRKKRVSYLLSGDDPRLRSACSHIIWLHKQYKTLVNFSRSFVFIYYMYEICDMRREEKNPIHFHFFFFFHLHQHWCFVGGIFEHCY